MGNGLFGYFGLFSWFQSFSPSEQSKILACVTGPNGELSEYGLQPQRLVEGRLESTSMTAVQLLTALAEGALAKKDHQLCDVLMAKASEMAKLPEDVTYWRWMVDKIGEEKAYTPDQRAIDLFKTKILLIIGNEPGVIQSHLKRRFAPEDEAAVGHALSQLTREAKLRREKKGNSFKLYV